MAVGDPGSLTALILAGRRSGADPVACAAGVSHKALVPVGGRPMLMHVVDSLRSLPRIGRVILSSDDAEALQSVPELRELLASGALEYRASAGSPADSVRESLAGIDLPGPLLVTTADHPLLTPQMIEYFCDAAEGTSADVVAAVVSASVLLDRFPDARRTFIPLRGESVTGSNLFWFRSKEGARAAAFWRQTEQVRKRPWRLAALFGIRTLASFALRRLDLEQAAERISSKLGLRAAVVRMPFAECGIDVDRPEHLALVERILAEVTARVPTAARTPGIPR